MLEENYMGDKNSEKIPVTTNTEKVHDVASSVGMFKCLCSNILNVVWNCLQKIASIQPVTIKEIIKTLHAIVAIVIGGIWTYKIFIKERHHYAHANIELKASHIPLFDDINLLRIDIEISNTGTSLLVLKKQIVRVQQILPKIHNPRVYPINKINAALKERKQEKNRFVWPLLSEIVKDNNTIFLEPGESQTLDYEFAIKSKVKIVRIYSYVRNEQRSKDGKEIGWTVSTYYKMKETNKEELNK